MLHHQDISLMGTCHYWWKWNYMKCSKPFYNKLLSNEFSHLLQVCMLKPKIIFAYIILSIILLSPPPPMKTKIVGFNFWNILGNNSSSLASIFKFIQVLMGFLMYRPVLRSYLSENDIQLGISIQHQFLEYISDWKSDHCLYKLSTAQHQIYSKLFLDPNTSR